MARVDRQRRTHRQARFFGDQAIELCGLLGAATILPDNRRRQRLAVGVDKDVRVDLAAEPDARDGVQRNAMQDFAKPIAWQIRSSGACSTKACAGRAVSIMLEL